jgi:hypothetical protein
MRCLSITSDLKLYPSKLAAKELYNVIAIIIRRILHHISKPSHPLDDLPYCCVIAIFCA